MAAVKDLRSLVATVVVVDMEVPRRAVLDLVSIPSANRFRKNRSRRRGQGSRKSSWY